ncbi:VIR protein [Plasmodium vivax]|uniref:VIR protein n=1 Tax=Plasmodium vivax TaxID=5855 RepID=A0A1G4E8P8_PLAVI|nr:VIR protein [Plasmodium vivax]
MFSGKEYTLDKIKQNHPFIEHSIFYKIYNEYHKECKVGTNEDACYKETSILLSSSSEENELLEKLYSNLYKIFSTLNITTNDYFENIDLKDEKLGCLCLKYWLYDQIILKGFSDSQIVDIYEGWKKNIENKISYHNLKPCEFYNLKKDEINKIKNIYSLYAILHDNSNNYEICNNDNCKYLDYFGEGLDEFINSIKKCSTKESRDNYCKELDDFLNVCNVSDAHTGISIHSESERYGAETAGKYLLSVEKYENKPLYLFLKNEKLVNFVRTSHFIRTQNRNTIAATSVVGSAIGLSSIFYYFYKFTPFGNSIRRGKGKNIVNIDEEPHNSLLYTSDTEQIPFNKREYKVAYHTLNNT